MGPIEPEKPAAPKPPIPEADIAEWLKQLSLAVRSAEKAHGEKDFKKRDAAIIEVAKWSEKILDPHEVSQANRLKAFEITAPFARQMIEWKSYFAKGSMTYSGVRLSTFINTAKGAELAKMLGYKADLKSAEDYAILAFDDYKRILEIPEADLALVKHAAIRCILAPPNNDRSYLKPIYARLLALPLTPAEQKEWKLKQQLYIIDVDYKGDEHDVAMAAVKARIDDAKLPLAERNELAAAYGNELVGDDKKAFIETMITTTQANPAMAAEWTFKRGIAKVQESKWKEAVADYRAAMKLAPAGSERKDYYAAGIAMLSFRKLEATTEVVPELEIMVKSKVLERDERFEAALILHDIAATAKNFELAKARMIAARDIAGDDLHLKAKANTFLAQAQVGLGQYEEALATWNLIPIGQINTLENSPLRGGVKTALTVFASLFYSQAANAKKYALATTIIDKARKDGLFFGQDYTLLEVDLKVRQEKFDEAILVLQALEAIVQTETDKTYVQKLIAGVQAKKAEKKNALKPAAE